MRGRGWENPFDQLEEACQAATLRFNLRIHTVTREKPVYRLVRELGVLHRVPDAPYTTVFGETRAATWSSTISYRGARYSVPHAWMGARVWVRVSGEEIIIFARVDDAPTEIAKHVIVGSGEASIVDAHYPPRRDTPARVPKPTSRFEVAFVKIGEGAQVWLIEAADLGIRGIETKMGDAVALTQIHDPAAVDDALAAAAQVGRFGDDDLESILTYCHRDPILAPVGFSLQPGTQTWSQQGTTNSGNGEKR